MSAVEGEVPLVPTVTAAEEAREVAVFTGEYADMKKDREQRNNPFRR
jgi:pyridoxine 5'-phosphate synthase PdxJ